jgi:hypothetical protein
MMGQKCYMKLGGDCVYLEAIDLSNYLLGSNDGGL